MLKPEFAVIAEGAVTFAKVSALLTPVAGVGLVPPNCNTSPLGRGVELLSVGIVMVALVVDPVIGGKTVLGDVGSAMVKPNRRQINGWIIDELHGCCAVGCRS
jgi:hypothetical protein